MATYILVHGAWHGAWCWEKIVPLLEAAGHQVRAVDLPGHGADTTPLAGRTLESYAQRVCAEIDTQSEPVILVGHSMGGIVVSQAAEYRPARIAMLVYLAAFLLPDGTPMIQAALADTESLIGPNLVLLEDQGIHFIREEARASVLYNQCPPDDVARALARLVPEANAVVGTPLHLSEANFGRVPRIYIETEHDQTLGPGTQRSFYEALPCRTVLSLPTDHSPFYSAPRALADQLLGLAGGALLQPAAPGAARI